MKVQGPGPGGPNNQSMVQQALKLGKTAGEVRVIADGIVIPPTRAFRPQRQKPDTAKKADGLAKTKLSAFVSGTVEPAKRAGIEQFAGGKPQGYNTYSAEQISLPRSKK